MIVKNIKFLLVDDDPFFRSKLKESLIELDFQGPFLEAEDGVQAINIVKKNSQTPIDFIVCDVYMPNMDGIQFLSQLKTEQLLENPTPILMLTAENDLKIAIECIKLGANSYLLKPWSNADLAKKIVTAWDNTHRLG